MTDKTTTPSYTITLTKAQAQAMMLHACKDNARENLCSVSISDDGIALTTQGHTMFTIRAEDSAADPKTDPNGRSWITFGREAIDRAIKLAAAKQYIHIDASTREVHVLNEPPTPGVPLDEVGSFPMTIIDYATHAESAPRIFPSYYDEDRATRVGFAARYLKVLGDTMHKLQDSVASVVVWSTPVDSLDPSVFEISSRQRGVDRLAEIVVMPMRI